MNITISINNIKDIKKGIIDSAILRIYCVKFGINKELGMYVNNNYLNYNQTVQQYIYCI